MKKTLTVNLGGTVYHIDEDAYVLLDNYLNNLKYHFLRRVFNAQRIHLAYHVGWSKTNKEVI